MPANLRLDDDLVKRTVPGWTMPALLRNYVHEGTG